MSTWTSIGDPDLLCLPSHLCCPGAPLANLFLENKDLHIKPDLFLFLCRSTPSSKSRTREPSGSPCSSIETSSCVFSAQEERVCTELQFYGRPGSGQVQDSPQQDPSEGVPDSSLEADVTNPEETPTLDSFCPHLNAEKQEQNRSSGWCSALVLTRRFGRQLSEGGVCSPSQNPFPFPSRRPPRLSEAARRLGLYSPWETHTSSWNLSGPKAPEHPKFEKLRNQTKAQVSQRPSFGLN